MVNVVVVCVRAFLALFAAHIWLCCSCCCHAWRREREGRWEVGPAVVAACELPHSARGVRALVRCGGDGGGVGACAVVGHRATKDQVIKIVLFLAHVSIIQPS